MVNLERCSFLLDVTIWTIGWHWYWQPNASPAAMHIHEPVTGKYLLQHPLYATGKRCAWVHRCIVSRRTRAKIIARYIYSMRRIALKGNGIRECIHPLKWKNHYVSSPAHPLKFYLFWFFIINNCNVVRRKYRDTWQNKLLKRKIEMTCVFSPVMRVFLRERREDYFVEK